jgi:peptidoglycan-N-acetylglucosamine deacetylase
MTRIGTRQAVLGFLVSAPALALIVWRISPFAAIGVVALSHVFLMLPIALPTLQWFGPVVTRFETKRKEIWLTIDDGPDPVDTPLILDLLDRHAARATFFVQGARVRSYPELAAEILRRGHTLGNHSDSHPSASFWCLGPRALAREIDRCTQTLAQLDMDAAPRLFRAPVGMKNPFVHPLLRKRGMVLVAWDIRGYDGVDPEPHNAARRILRRIAPGSVIVMHEGRRTRGGGSRSYPCVEHVVKQLSADGYKFVVPDESSLVCGGDA